MATTVEPELQTFRADANDAAATPWWWSGVVVVLLASLALFKLSTTDADPDLWGHLRFGLDVLESGRLESVDPYSYATTGTRWINHEWLAEVLLALAYRAAGPLGIAVEKAMLGLLLAWLVYAFLRQQGVGLLGAGILTVYGMLAIYPGLASLRPQVFTYLGFFATLWILVRTTDGAPRALWLLPPLYALWPNLHGGFVAGLAVLALWWGASLLTQLVRPPAARGETPALHRGRRGAPLARRDDREYREYLSEEQRRQRGCIAGRMQPAFHHGLPGHRRDVLYEHTRSALPLLAAGVATLANPYGIGLWWFLIENLGPRPDISEWQPVEMFNWDGLFAAGLLVLALIGLFRTRRRRSPALTMVWIAMACTPHLATRHLPLFALSVLAIAGPHIADAFARWAPRLDGAAWPVRLGRLRSSLAQGRLSRLRRPAGATALAPARYLRPFAALMLIEALLLSGIAIARLPHVSYRAARFPARAVAWLEASRVDGNLLVFFDWGEYALWHLSPRLRVSYDGRRETVYPASLRAEHHAFYGGRDGWSAVLDRGAPTLALIDARFPGYQLLRTRPDWVLLLEDGDAALFGRTGHATTTQLQGTPLPPPVATDARLAFP